MTSNSKSAESRTLWGLAALLVAASVLLCWEINEPFVGQHDSCTAEFSQWARHWVRYGVVRTRMGQIINAGPLEMIDKPHYYVHCMPVLTAEIALSFKIFGVHEWSARLVPILHSLAVLVLTFLLGRTLWGDGEGLAAAAFLTFMPMFAYYGRIAEYVIVACPLFLLVLILYRRWIDEPTKPRLWALVLACFFTGLYSHEGYVFVALIALHCAFVVGRANRSLAAIVLAPALALLLQLSYVAFLLGGWDTLADIRDVWARRGPTATHGFSLLDLWVREGIWFMLYFTPVVSILCLAGVLGRLFSRPKHARKGGWILIIYPVHAFIMASFWQGLAYNHDYFLYSLTPAAALASGRVLILLQKARALRRRPFVRWPFLAGILGVHAWFGLSYTRFIHEIDFFTPSYNFARLINQRTAFGEGVMTNLHRDQYQPTFLFYVDRHLAYEVGSDADVRRLLSDKRRNYRLLALSVQETAQP